MVNVSSSGAFRGAASLSLSLAVNIEHDSSSSAREGTGTLDEVVERNKFIVRN